jgi:hypothetical protein
MGRWENWTHEEIAEFWSEYVKEINLGTLGVNRTIILKRSLNKYGRRMLIHLLHERGSARFCKHGKDPSGFIQGDKFPE